MAERFLNPNPQEEDPDPFVKMESDVDMYWEYGKPKTMKEAERVSTFNFKITNLFL